MCGGSDTVDTDMDPCLNVGGGVRADPPTQADGALVAIGHRRFTTPTREAVVAREPSPAFQFYARDWLGDPDQVALTCEQAGAYIRMLAWAWLKVGLPNDPARIARVVGTTEEVVRVVLDAHFELRGDVWVNPRQERVRAEQMARRDAGERGGQASVERRRERYGSAQPKPIPKHSRSKTRSLPEAGFEAPPEANPEASPNPASASSSASASASAFASSSAPASASTPPIVPPRGDISAENSADLSGFDAFWSAYPRKTAKGAARKAWAVLNPSPDLQTRILEAVSQHRSCRQWLSEGGRFIPHPATWLNQKRWEDELDPDVPMLSSRTVGNLAAGEAWLRGHGVKS